MNRTTLLHNVYHAMLDKLGPSSWWPGETPFEVAVGAILTQNTNWVNVEKAIANIREAGCMNARSMAELPEARLQEMLRPAGYFRLKATRLRHFLDFLRVEADWDISALARRDTDDLRARLLAVKGIGPETADCILLYSLDKPVFVVDAYTHRILTRHGQVPEEAGYDEMREFFMDVLSPDTALYGEYHALVVRVGKQWCKKRAPVCDGCPLQRFLD